jgi:PBP1b-binding outer membrane lipoprotein LpoB
MKKEAIAIVILVLATLLVGCSEPAATDDVVEEPAVEEVEELTETEVEEDLEETIVADDDDVDLGEMY